jgi:hypothetical protein
MAYYKANCTVSQRRVKNIELEVTRSGHLHTTVHENRLLDQASTRTLLHKFNFSVLYSLRNVIAVLFPVS